MTVRIISEIDLTHFIIAAAAGADDIMQTGDNEWTRTKDCTVFTGLLDHKAGDVYIVEEPKKPKSRRSCCGSPATCQCGREMMYG